jgi:energy-coupling factor transporter ATP-binding protein EcfA2
MLLLLDEPTAGMSAAETHEAISLLERIAGERELTLLFTEHDMEVVFAQKIAILHQGRKTASGAARLPRAVRPRCAPIPRSAASILIPLMQRCCRWRTSIPSMGWQEDDQKQNQRLDPIWPVIAAQPITGGSAPAAPPMTLRRSSLQPHPIDNNIEEDGERK